MNEYQTWADLNRALRSRTKTFAKQHGVSAGRIGELQLRDRFLVRVFDGDREGWVLKGGTGMLARTVQARSTRDVDLVATGEIEDAVAQLEQLVDREFGDHLRFQLVKRGAASTTPGGRTSVELRFEARAGTTKVGAIKIDLVVGTLLTTPAVTQTPALRVPVPGLPVADYQLYPAVHAVADKVAATMATYSGNPSTRDHDLVDLVILANTETFGAAELAQTVHAELIRRKVPVDGTFVIPQGMAPGYNALARDAADCAAHPRFEDADALMQTFIAPLLDRSRTTGTWARLEWQP